MPRERQRHIAEKGPIEDPQREKRDAIKAQDCTKEEERASPSRGQGADSAACSPPRKPLPTLKTPPDRRKDLFPRLLPIKNILIVRGDDLYDLRSVRERREPGVNNTKNPPFTQGAYFLATLARKGKDRDGSCPAPERGAGLFCTPPFQLGGEAFQRRNVAVARSERSLRALSAARSPGGGGGGRGAAGVEGGLGGGGGGRGWLCLELFLGGGAESVSLADRAVLLLPLGKGGHRCILRFMGGSEERSSPRPWGREKVGVLPEREENGDCVVEERRDAYWQGGEAG